LRIDGTGTLRIAPPICGAHLGTRQSGPTVAAPSHGVAREIGSAICNDYHIQRIRERLGQLFILGTFGDL